MLILVISKLCQYNASLDIFYLIVKYIEYDNITIHFMDITRFVIVITINIVKHYLANHDIKNVFYIDSSEGYVYNNLLFH